MKYHPIILGILLILSPLLVGAATFVSPSTGDSADPLVARTYAIDTEGEMVNAVEGEMTYDPQLLTFKSVADGDSILREWLHPVAVEKEGRVIFSGIIPGGYRGSLGRLFTIYFTPHNVGEMPVQVSGRAYRNDGNATLVDLRTLMDTINVVDRSSGVRAASMVDTEAPREVKAVVSQNSAMFEGKPFVIVDAKDTRSGIARYELLETGIPHSIASLEKDLQLPWKSIDNPAVLKVPLEKYVYVRVFDRMGNVAVAAVTEAAGLSPEDGAHTDRVSKNVAILVGGLVSASLLYWMLRKRHG